MRLILFRHGIAREARAGEEDAARPLTAKGMRRTTMAAAGLACCLESRPAIYSSPKTRAWQTAGILGETISVQIAAQPLLAEGDVWAVAHWLQGLREQEVVLVGHEPQLGQLVSLLCTGDGDRLRVDVRKAGAVILFGLDPERPGWLVHAVLAARVLRQLGQASTAGGAASQETI